MFHIIRGIQQDKSKKFVMDELNLHSGVLLSDWAMKILPQAHREKMDDWFGKKGISLHVDVLFYMDTNNNVQKLTYFTAIDRCLQDMASVLCVFEHVIDQMRKDVPHLNTLYTRSDNAGCYSGSAVIMTREKICSNAGIYLKRTDFSEPQRGKDQADREIAVAKSCLQAYTNHGGNLLDANSIKKALDDSISGTKNCKTSVIVIDESKCVLPKIKIDGITKYHSAAFDQNLITFWQYFNIGNGKSLKIKHFQYVLCKSVVKPFNNLQNKNKPFEIKNNSIATVFFCSTDSCSGSFETEDELILHEQKAEHIFDNQSSLSSMDLARYLYLDHLKGARISEEISNKFAIQSFENSNNENIQLKYHTELEKLFLEKGYAIRRRQKSKKMTNEQQIFFIQLFNRGEETGKKVSIDVAYQEMRSTLKTDNTKLFSTNQYLTKNQIRSFFGRLARKKNNNQQIQPTIDNDDNDNGSINSEEDDAEHYFKVEQEREFKILKQNIVDNVSSSYSDDESESDEVQ